jgi:hypothetical protein
VPRKYQARRLPQFAFARNKYHGVPDQILSDR